jgi:hypothetical protein
VEFIFFSIVLKQYIETPFDFCRFLYAIPVILITMAPKKKKNNSKIKPPSGTRRKTKASEAMDVETLHEAGEGKYSSFIHHYSQQVYL